MRMFDGFHGIHAPGRTCRPRERIDIVISRLAFRPQPQQNSGVMRTEDGATEAA